MKARGLAPPTTPHERRRQSSIYSYVSGLGRAIVSPRRVRDDKRVVPFVRPPTPLTSPPRGKGARYLGKALGQGHWRWLQPRPACEARITVSLRREHLSLASYRPGWHRSHKPMNLGSLSNCRPLHAIRGALGIRRPRCTCVVWLYARRRSGSLCRPELADGRTGVQVQTDPPVSLRVGAPPRPGSAVAASCSIDFPGALRLRDSWRSPTIPPHVPPHEPAWLL